VIEFTSNGIVRQFLRLCWELTWKKRWPIPAQKPGGLKLGRGSFRKAKRDAPNAANAAIGRKLYRKYSKVEAAHQGPPRGEEAAVK
jgi:hypothetical protein